MNNYFKFIKKNYITLITIILCLIIILFFLFLFFIKKNYKLIILYSLFVGIFYFFLNKYFVLVLILIPITFIFNFKQNETFKAPNTIVLSETEPVDDYDKMKKDADDSAEDQIDDEDKEEPTKCEQMFLVQSKVPDIAKARRDGRNQNVGGGEQKAAASTFETQVNKISKIEDITHSPLS